MDRFPLPCIDDLLDCLSKATIFTKVDLTNAYHWVETAPADQFKIAFVTPRGLFELKVFPLGLYNAPATFQYLIHKIFANALDYFMTIYLNNILVFSSDFQQHL